MKLARAAGLLITFWAGSLWAICALVAPTLFRILENRRLAGQLAATFFNALTWIGVAVATVLLVLNLAGKLALPSGKRLSGRGLILITAGLPLASHLILGPLMDQARAAGNMARFGMLHGVAGACFVLACISAALLVWKFNRPAE